MKILYFAQAAQLAECREEVWQVDMPCNVSDFWAEVIRRHPRLEILKNNCRLAVNMDFIESDARLNAEDEVAVIPPVSGG